MILVLIPFPSAFSLAFRIVLKSTNVQGQMCSHDSWITAKTINEAFSICTRPDNLCFFAVPKSGVDYLLSAQYLVLLTIAPYCFWDRHQTTGTKVEFSTDFLSYLMSFLPLFLIYHSVYASMFFLAFWGTLPSFWKYHPKC